MRNRPEILILIGSIVIAAIAGIYLLFSSNFSSSVGLFDQILIRYKFATKTEIEGEDRWVNLFEDFRYKKDFDINSVEYDIPTGTLRFWERTIDKGSREKGSYLEKCEVKIPKKEYRTLDSEKTSEDSAMTERYNAYTKWSVIQPDSDIEKAVNEIAEKFYTPRLSKSKEHEWKTVFKDKDYEYEVCKDYYGYDGEILTIFYKQKDVDIKSKFFVGYLEINVKNNRILSNKDSSNGKTVPISPGTFEEAAYKEMSNVIK